MLGEARPGLKGLGFAGFFLWFEGFKGFVCFCCVESSGRFFGLLQSSQCGIRALPVVRAVRALGFKASGLFEIVGFQGFGAWGV